MKVNEAFKRFFSLSTWKNITLYLLLFFLGTASILALAFYEPWRYLTIARSSDLILPKDPLSYPSLMIIESPHIDIAKHQTPIHPDLPPLYTKLPNNLPKEVKDYVEKRNSYIRQLNDKYANSPNESRNSLIMEELLPYQYKGKVGFFAFLSENENKRLSLFDTSLNEITEIDQSPKGDSTIVSAKFQDRVWSFYHGFGNASARVNCEEIIYHQEPIINSFLMGSKYQDIEHTSFSIMKIAHKNTNPRIKTHISYPKGFFFFPLFFLHNFMTTSMQANFGIAYLLLSYSLNSILLFLGIIILTLFLAYIGIILAQRKRSQAKESKCFKALKKTLKKISSIDLFDKITLFLLLLSIISVSILALSIHQPWRFLKILKRDELLLPKDPFSMPDLYIIEAANLDLDKYAQRWGTNLPPLYVNLPKSLPKEVLDYLEKRNSYIRKMYDLNLMPEETLLYTQVLPFIYQDQEGIVYLAVERHTNRSYLSLYDSSFNLIVSEASGAFASVIVSAKHQDRFWYRFDMNAATGGYFYYIRSNYEVDSMNYTKEYIGGTYDDMLWFAVGFWVFELEPFNRMKITNVSTNPEMKIHFQKPENPTSFDNNSIPSVNTVVYTLIFVIAILSTLLFILFSLILLIVWLLRTRKMTC